MDCGEVLYCVLVLSLKNYLQIVGDVEIQLLHPTKRSAHRSACNFFVSNFLSKIAYWEDITFLTQGGSILSADFV